MINLIQGNISDYILKAANEHRETMGYVYNKITKWQIIYNNVIVGFLSARLEKGYYRTSAIFIIDEYRNLGIGTKVIKDFYKDKKGKAVISTINISSQTIFKKAGFIKTERVIMDGSLTCHLYIKEVNEHTIENFC